MGDMEGENSNKLENITEKINYSRDKALELRQDVEMLSDSLESDLEGQKTGAYFATEGGHDKFTEVREELEDLGRYIQENFGLAAFTGPERVENLIGLDSKTSRQLAGIGNIYEESTELLEDSAENYLEELKNGQSDLYGDQDMDDIISEGETRREDGRMVYSNISAWNPLDQLSAVGEALDESSVDYNELARISAADD